jgi:hypothetical protein
MSNETTFDDLAKEARASRAEDAIREFDLALLRALVDEREDTPDEHRGEFADMLERMRRSPAGFRFLTDKQRLYAENVADRHGISIPRRPSQTAANVPRGREVATPVVLSRDSLRAALNARRIGR